MPAPIWMFIALPPQMTQNPLAHGIAKPLRAECIRLLSQPNGRRDNPCDLISCFPFGQPEKGTSNFYVFGAVGSHRDVDEVISLYGPRRSKRFLYMA